jgi:hypothetical protein
VIFNNLFNLFRCQNRHFYLPLRLFRPTHHLDNHHRRHQRGPISSAHN